MDPTKQIYTKLLHVIPNLRNIGTYAKLSAPGFMDLHLDRLEKYGGLYKIALSLYYKHLSGDMITDPDMTVRIDKMAQTVEALTYQDIYRYDEVYPDGTANQSTRLSLNSFLAQWLQNSIDQGHRFSD